MEVLSLGFSRTGTLSMQKALSILGYPDPYHFSSFYDNVKDCDLWVEALQAKFNGKGKPYGEKEFDALLGHVGAVTDLPCIAFAKELIELYPEAKVVLVERNVDAWYKSWSTFMREGFNPFLFFLARLDSGFLGKIVAVGYLGCDQRCGGATNLGEALARSKEEYAKHYAFVRSITPRERLLEFDLKDGWGPLCKFLGKPIPDEPFPHLNESKSVQAVFQEMMKKGMRNIARNVGIGLAVVGIPVMIAWKYST